jgi:hypothetical protein
MELKSIKLMILLLSVGDRITWAGLEDVALLTLDLIPLQNLLRSDLRSLVVEYLRELPTTLE